MSPLRMARIESAVRVIIQLINSFNQGDTSGVAELLAEGAILDAPSPGPNGSAYHGRTDIMKYIEGVLVTYPHSKLETEELVGFGNRDFLRWDLCLNTETDLSEPHRGVTLFLIREGKILEMLSYSKSE